MSAPTATIPLAELTEGVATRVLVADVPVAVVRLDGAVYAIGDTCSHGRVSLSGGEVFDDEFTIECPKHGSTFDLRTGVPTCLPATQPVATFAVSIDGDTVTISPTDHDTADAAGAGAGGGSEGAPR